MLESASAASQPSDADLDAAFTVADEDGNGVVDEDEFVRLMRLVKKGEV
jgi:Ca2+-binding EF-hand superfamily protein